MFGIRAENLRKDMLEDESPAMKRRRKIIGLSVAGVVIMATGVLRQTGIIRHLPDPPCDCFNSDKVATSEEAFVFGAPDATLAAASIAINMPLAAYGEADRAQKRPLVPLAAFAKTLIDAAGTVWYWHEMRHKEKTWCVYCIGVGLVNLSVMALSVPEAAEAWTKLTKGGTDGGKSGDR